MQLNKLLSRSLWFVNNITENQIPQKYSVLHSKMNQNIRRNNQSLVPFEQEKTDLIKATIDLNFQSLNLEQIKFLNKLKIIELLRKRGVEQIEQVLIQNNLDIATATGKIKEFSNTITKSQNIFKELQTTLLKSFDIEETNEINGSQVLMRVYFQNDVAIKNLTDFKKLSATWYDIGRGIAMAQNSSIKENVNNREIEKGKESQKFKLNNLENQNKYLQEEWKGNSKSLTTKIETHLLDANSTGLAHSYLKEKNYYKYPTIIWSTVFTLTMIVIVYYAVKKVTDTYTYEIRNALMNILSRVTFSLPTI